MPVFGLAALFLFTAALYASVGFGGGSTYIALLALAEVDYRLIPVIALVCNIIVVLGGTIRFQLRGLVDWQRVWPILLLSVPAAWFGGRIPIERDSFLLLLGGALLVAGVLLLTETLIQQKHQSDRPLHWVSHSLFPPVIGAAIGFLSGMVGIGGGIFLAPILLLTHWADNRRVAATASVFIFVNSVAGLAGQMMKPAFVSGGERIPDYWPLFLAVLIGGQIGSYLASKKLKEAWIRSLTAMLVLYVAVTILWRQLI